MSRAILGVLPWVFALGAAAAPVHPPIRHYTFAQGLAQDEVRRIAFDREGFLWVATEGGLSRFDGEQFIGFGTADGLRGQVIHDLAIGGDGTYWVATDKGLFAFRPREAAPAGRLFFEVPLEGVPERDGPHRVLVDRSSVVWVGTFGRVWRLTSVGRDFRVDPVELPELNSRVQSLAEDPTGAVWIGSHLNGLFRVSPDGRVDHCHRTVTGADFVRAFLFPGDGSVWTAYFGGVAMFDRPPFGDPPPTPRLYGSAEGLEIDTEDLFAAADDRVLVATTVGITELRRIAPGSKDWQLGPTLDRRTGLPADGVRMIARDPWGNLWVAMLTRGLVKLMQNGFSSVPDTERVGSAIVDLANDRDGRIVALAAKGAKALTVYQPEGQSPGPFRVSLPPATGYIGWGDEQKLLVDHVGSWWIASGSGLLRYDDPRRLGARRVEQPPDAVYGMQEGLSGIEVFVLFEDARGDVWISAQPRRAGASAVSKWSRATGRIDSFPASAVGTTALAVRFLQTRDGSLWIRFYDGSLQRVRDGRFQPITIEADTAEMLEDAQGRLWTIGASLRVCQAPAAAQPSFAKVDLPAGDDGVVFRCAVEGRDARLWLGTNQGIVSYHPGTGQVRRFTVDDGLVGNSISLCHRDGSGALWFSDKSGLSKLEAKDATASSLPPARLREIRIAGEAVPLPSLGSSSAGPLRIPAERRRLSVEFFAVHDGSGSPVRFQYRLEGSDREWSTPTRNRRVEYGQLAPGGYRFLVRTVSEDGKPSDAPAVVSLDVLAPLWQRGWFLALCVVAATGIGYSLHRVRVARAIALERVRTRIATDLHDDIGSSLSQIAILSQLAARRPELQQRITALAGEVIDAMSDVVWAISPRWDTLAALVTRMRRFASELFPDESVALELHLPDGGDERIDPQLRRQLYLVFKEALHNVRRHAEARCVRVELGREGKEWVLHVEEDGRGFDPDRESEGHGLRSMRQRAERVGGRLDVRSSPEGTRLTLRIPEKLLTG